MAKFIVQTIISGGILVFACWNLWFGFNKEWAASAIGSILGWWLEAPSIRKSLPGDRKDSE